MNRTITRSGLFVSILVGLSGFVSGQTEADHPFDRKNGEQYQIRERDRWFRSTRGFESVERPDALRALAVRSVQRWRSENRSSTLQWIGQGPESMSMLGWAMGPVSGRVSALAVHPTQENVLFLGAASGGLWKTTDGGNSWQPLFDEVGTLTIGSITIEPDRPERIWVGTGEQGQYCGSYFGLGLFLSTDGGTTFNAMNGAVGGALELSYVSSVAVHPENPDIVLAGGHGWCDDGQFNAGGLFRSTDGGLSWQKLLHGPASDIIIDPVDVNTAYAAVGRWGWSDDGIYKSVDGGATWDRMQTGIPFGQNVGRIRLSMAASNHGVLYALVNNSSNSNSRLFRTVNGGENWELKHTNACEGQCSYDLCLDVHPNDAERLLVGSIRFAESSDSGTTLTYKTDGWGWTQKVHQDTHVVLYSRATENRYWVGTDGGIWRTDDGGASFQNLNANLVLTQFYDVEIHPFDEQVVFGGSQDNSSERRNGSQHWEVTVATGDGFMNAIDRQHPTTVFQTSYPWDGKPSIVKSTSGGGPDSFEWMNTSGIGDDEPFPWVTPLVTAGVESGPSGSGSSQLLVASNRIYRGNSDQPAGGFAWTPVSPNLAGGSGAVSVMTPFVAGGSVGVFAGLSNGRIWRTDDIMLASTTSGWVEITGDYPGGRVSDIAVTPGNPDRVFVTSSIFGQPQLYRSVTGGGSWQPIGIGLPNVPANSVAIDPIYPGRVFIGTDVGVFVSHDSGETAEPEGAGMPMGLVVTDVEIDRSPYVVTVGTYGRGVFRANLEGTFEDLFSDGFESGDVAAWSASVFGTLAP